MKSSTQVKAIADGIHAEIQKDIASLTEVKKAKVASLSGMGADEGLEVISGLAADVEAVIKAANAEGVTLPSFLSRIITEGDSLASVTVSVRSKLKASYKYRKDTPVDVNEDFIENLAQAYLAGLWDIFYIEQAIENVDALNAKVAELVEANQIPYSIEFRVDHTTDAHVLEISNDKVVFNADIVRALNIAELGIFKGGDEFSDLINKESIEEFVNAIKAIQTPVQLIKGKVGLVTDVTGLNTKQRASKLIHKSYHRQAKYLSSIKSGVGYFEDTVSINGEDVDVFALVSKAEDGTLAVVLNPFDVKTLFNVDFDVISAVKAQMK